MTTIVYGKTGVFSSNLEIENMSESEPSAHQMNLRAFKDTTNNPLVSKGKTNKVANEKENFLRDEDEL
jgi:deferrochelatase/peroxidase EfeB